MGVSRTRTGARVLVREPKHDSCHRRPQRYALPATEGKRNDPRWPAFARRHGFDIDHSVQWEVEALPPDELQRLVLAAVAPYIDRDVLTRQITRKKEQHHTLAAFLNSWDPAGGAGPS